VSTGKNAALVRGTWCVLIALCGGCPGTIDDPTIFGELAEPPAGEPVLDAGTLVDARVADPPRTEDAGGTRPVDAGTPGAVVDAAPPAPACDFKALMQTKCGNAACHGGPTNSTGLDLTSEGLAARLMGESGSGVCGTKQMIDLDDPADSVLYLTVTGSSCGTRMPIGASLTEGEQTCILRWIENL